MCPDEASWTAGGAGGPAVTYQAVSPSGADDTANLKAAVASVVAAGQANGTNYGEVWFNAGRYLCSSPTTKGGATQGNAQIPLPIIPSTGQKFTLVLRGVHDASAFYHWNQATPQTSGVIIVCTLTGLAVDGTWGAPSIIGGPTEYVDPAGGGTSFSNMLLVLDGITIQAPANPGIVGVDAAQVAQCNVGTLSFLTPEVPSSHPVPTNGLGIALRMPQLNNNDNCNIDNLSVEAWTYALAMADHVVCKRLAAIYTNTVLFIANNAGGHLHGAHFDYISAEGGSTCIVAQGTTGQFPLHIGMLDAEGQQGTFDIDDVDNTLVGDIGWADNLGHHPSLRGATNLRITDMQQLRGHVAAPAVPATTVALANPFFRDAAVTVTGGTVTAITVDGTATGLTSGTVIVPSGKTVAITYTVAPAWNWVLL